MASVAASEKSFHSMRSQDKAFDRHLRLREGMFDLGPSESYQRPVYNALLDPVMGEFFDRGGRRRHLEKAKMVNEYGELNDDRKMYEEWYREVRKAKEEEREFEKEIRDEIAERRRAVAVRKNQDIEERRLNRINEIREDHRQRVHRIRQAAAKRLEKYTGPGNFWLAFKAANAFTSMLNKDGKGGRKPWEEPDWEDRAVRMIQRCWRGKIARRIAEEKRREKEEKDRKRYEMRARAMAAAGPGYAAPKLVTQNSFKADEAFKEGTASTVTVPPNRTASGHLMGIGGASQKGGRALEDMSPLEAYTLEDRKKIVKIQAAARARKAKTETEALRQKKNGGTGRMMHRPRFDKDNRVVSENGPYAYV